jgi:hypothetical protein
MVSPHIQSVIHQFESVTLDSIDQLVALYDSQAFFKDPFNEVSGHLAIRRIFTHMFTQVLHPKFKIQSVLEDHNQACLTWEFLFEFKSSPNTPQSIRGCTWFVFNEAGLILSHRDYWDAAEELYEKLPYLGRLMKWLKRKAQH